MAIPKPQERHDPECRYVRRTPEDKWEYGKVERGGTSAKPANLREGVCDTYEEACALNNMALAGATHTPYRGYTCFGKS